jgi:mannose-6-phosphate isomerase
MNGDMNDHCYPLLFRPVYKEYFWGGRRIADRFARTGTPAVCAESWEISAHPDGLSRVANGACAGQTLAALAGQFGAACTGTRAPDPHRFPLLFKLIDARENLSVQVHPNDENAAAVGGEAKTEAWYVVERGAEASLYSGFKPGVTADSFQKSLAQGDAAARLIRQTIAPGDTLFIPGGLVHAIGAGCLIYEVQQSSNTTYRLFDWNRCDASGTPRPLHIEQAFRVIAPTLEPPCLHRAPAVPADGANHTAILLCSPYFHLTQLHLATPLQVPLDGTSFQVLFLLAGAATVTAGGQAVPLTAGTSCLLPAACGSYQLHPSGTPATLLITTL